MANSLNDNGSTLVRIIAFAMVLLAADVTAIGIVAVESILTSNCTLIIAQIGVVLNKRNNS